MQKSIETKANKLETMDKLKRKEARLERLQLKQ